MTPVAICAIFRNEARYLREWLEFHLLVGVTEFYLYNHRSDDAWRHVVAPYVERGIVDVTSWLYNPPCQLQAYQDCIARLKGLPVWCAFIDCDEFLFSPTCDTLPQALGKLPYKAVAAHWMCFGSGGQIKYSPEPVIERFTKRAKADAPFNQHVKSIIRMDQAVDVGITPHYFATEHGTYREDGSTILGPIVASPCSSLLRINHYCTKSQEEWLERAAMGRPDRPAGGVPTNWYDDRQSADVDDREIQRFLPALKDRLALEVAA